MRFQLPWAVAFGLSGLWALATDGQGLPSVPSVPAVPSIPGPPGAPPLPAVPSHVPEQSPVLEGLSKEARDTLKMLHDRKVTLKDFRADIDYEVQAPRTGDVTGKQGTFDFINGPIKGPTLSADFTKDTAAGKVTRNHHAQIIFDGREFTVKDYGLAGGARTFSRQTALPSGAKPGDAATLDGPLPLPIGMKPEDVVEKFEVRALPASDPDQAILRLIPRMKSKFEFTQVEVTVDRRPAMQIPVKIVMTEPTEEVDTVRLSGVNINSGAAKLADPSTPASEGWIERE